MAQVGWGRLEGLDVRTSLQVYMLYEFCRQAADFGVALFNSSRENPMFTAFEEGARYVTELDLSSRYPEGKRGAPVSMIQYVSHVRNADWAEATRIVKGHANKFIVAFCTKLKEELGIDFVPSDEDREMCLRKFSLVAASHILQAPANELRIQQSYIRQGHKIKSRKPIVIKLTKGAVQ